jgi:hypothetical protein
MDFIKTQTNQLDQKNYPAHTDFICLAKSINNYTISFCHLRKQTIVSNPQKKI